MIEQTESERAWVEELPNGRKIIHGGGYQRIEGIPLGQSEESDSEQTYVDKLTSGNLVSREDFR